MCGIIGMINYNGITKSQRVIFEQMFVNCQSRGTDAFGYVSYPKNYIFKKKGEAYKHISKNDLQNVYNNNIVLGHTRFATTGSEKRNMNNHPFETRDFVMAHNGVIQNNTNFEFESNIKKKSDIETDSVVIVKSIQEQFEKHKDVEMAIKETTKKLYGSYACWVLFKKTGSVFLFRHGNPIEIAYNKEEDYVVFASEEEFYKFVEVKSSLKGFKDTLSMGEIEEDTVYRLTKKGLHNLGKFNTKSFGGYSTTSSYSSSAWKDEDEDETEICNMKGVKQLFKKKETSFDSEEDFDEWFMEESGYSFIELQRRVEPFGVKLNYEEQRIVFHFDDEGFWEDMIELFKGSGYTISPKTRKLTVRKLSELYEVVDIIVQGTYEGEKEDEEDDDDYDLCEDDLK